jgi:hypothetical protein
MRNVTTVLLAGAVIASLSGEAVSAERVHHAHLNARNQAVAGDVHQTNSDKHSMRYYGGPKSAMWRG